MAAWCPSNMLDGSAQTVVCTATLRYKLQIKLYISASDGILTLGQPVPALGPCRVATGVPVWKSLVSLNLDKDNNNNNNRIQRRYSRFFTVSSQHRELSPTRTLKWPGRNRVQITFNTWGAYHVQVSCYVPLGTKGQLSY